MIEIVFVDMHWHYWVGVCICMLINLIIMLNPIHYAQPWKLIVFPALFALLVYGAGGVVLPLIT